MDTMLVRERYKVVQVLDVRENYAFVEAVDILDREKNSCLLNIYEGPLLRAYLPCFDQLGACPGLSGGVFRGGEPGGGVPLPGRPLHRPGVLPGGTSTSGGTGWRTPRSCSIRC